VQNVQKRIMRNGKFMLKKLEQVDNVDNINIKQNKMKIKVKRRFG